MILKVPDGYGQFSVGGVTVTVNKKGLVTVPDELAHHLFSFGCVPAAPDDQADGDALAAFFEAQQRAQAELQAQIDTAAALAADEKRMADNKAITDKLQ